MQRNLKFESWKIVEKSNNEMVICVNMLRICTIECSEIFTARVKSKLLVFPFFDDHKELFESGIIITSHICQIERKGFDHTSSSCDSGAAL